MKTGSYSPNFKLANFKCSLTFSLYLDGWFLGRYNVPSSYPIFKIDLKNGLYGISPDLKLRIHAISDKSLNKAAFPLSYLMLFLIQLTLSTMPVTAHYSWIKISQAELPGLYSQI